MPPNVSIHLDLFLEVVATLALIPSVGYYWWRGRRRRALDEARRVQERGDRDALGSGAGPMSGIPDARTGERIRNRKQGK